MQRLFKLAGAVAIAASIAGCSTLNKVGADLGIPTPGPATPPPAVLPPPNTPAGQKAAEIIGKVQEEARKICRFVPTANTVAKILGTFGASTFPGLVEVASQICSVVGPPTAETFRRAKGPKKLRGVTIRGTYVR